MAAPGGTIIIVTWCHRDLSPSEESLRPEEKNLLDRICRAFYLPEWCSTADYVSLLTSLSMEVLLHLASHSIQMVNQIITNIVAVQDVKSADWSDNVAPFWPAVIKSALTWKGITSLLTSGNLDLPSQ